MNVGNQEIKMEFSPMGEQYAHTHEKSKKQKKNILRLRGDTG